MMDNEYSQTRTQDWNNQTCNTSLHQKDQPEIRNHQIVTLTTIFIEREDVAVIVLMTTMFMTLYL
jgi:hypothetical protein